ncbi:microtubule-associated protein 10-like [Stylophora pistillata]|uniref:Microtubule-associated protein 10 n=1 Tax=Stylophora pistillata TaxID=50429 RepID=A0A2B4SWD2_STYPI|nr:microtubule-associated protein 10-like [Stylophora pistillata]PFX32715.1 Microtubule-associated protein 10 [Stylophora pistillata]
MMAETLFSLEVHVESVEDLKVACKLPALCFRLLDFPTMIIHHVSAVDAEKIRHRLRMEGKDSVLHALKDRFGNFQFRKGKSCLFKASIDVLLIQLQTVPLYAMLMDLWPKKPLLLGSFLIPLKKAVDKISNDVYKNGVAVPSFYRDEGDFNMYNLMGSPIANVKLGFRLLSLGGSLIPHIGTKALGERITEKVETNEKVEVAVKGALEKVLPEIELDNEMTRNGFNIKSEHDARTVKKPDVRRSVEVQTNLPTKSFKTSRTVDQGRKASEEDVVITNTVCPPPLYYNYFSDSTPSGRFHSEQSSSLHVDQGHRQGFNQGEGTDVDFPYYDPGVVQTDGTANVTSVSVQTDEKLVKPSLGHQGGIVPSEFIQYNLQGVASESHLPILSALLQELSCLTRVGGDTHPSSLSVQSLRTLPTVQSKKLPSGYKGSQNVPKGETYRKQNVQATSQKKPQTSVIGLPRQRVRFKQTSLTYGMTKTQKMRLEMNQKEKLTNRTKGCEEHRALTEKDKIKRDHEKMPLPTSNLGQTYKIGMAKKQARRDMKLTADVQVQTQQLSTEGPHNEKSEIPVTTWVVKESIPLVDTEPNFPITDSAGSLKSQNSLEIFIPQVEGEPEERSDQEKEWTTDQATVGFYGNTGILSAELDGVRGSSAMSMYTEDFEDSGTEGSHASHHLAVTKSSSVDNENLKQRSNSDVSSASQISQGISAASGKPVLSSHSPVKAKSKRIQGRREREAGMNMKQKVTTSEQDSANQTSNLTKSSSSSSKHSAERSEASYSDDFHSVGSEPEIKHSQSLSDDSIDDNSQQTKLNLPPPASNLGYTY